MISSPLLSVCLLTYNHAPYIRQALDSILMQNTSFPFEICIGEDESNDGTREICIEYAEKYPDKIRLFLRNRKDVIYIAGHPTGRHNFIKTIQECRGKYIALLEGDDYWTDPDKLKKQVEALSSENKYSACFHDTLTIYDGIEDSGWRFDTFEKSTLYFEDVAGYKTPFHTSSIVFRKEMLHLPEFVKHVIFADFVIFSLLAHEGPIKYLQFNGSCYRRHEGGMTRSNLFQHYSYYSKCLEIINLLNKHTGYRYNNHLSSISLRYYYLYLKNYKQHDIKDYTYIKHSIQFAVKQLMFSPKEWRKSYKAIRMIFA